MPKKSVDKNHKPLTLNGHSFRIPSDAECLLDGWSTFGVQPIVIEPAEKIEGIPGAFVIASHSSVPNIPYVAPAIVAEIARRWSGIPPPRARQGHRRGRPQRRSLLHPGQRPPRYRLHPGPRYVGSREQACRLSSPPGRPGARGLSQRPSRRRVGLKRGGSTTVGPPLLSGRRSPRIEERIE